MEVILSKNGLLILVHPKLLTKFHYMSITNEANVYTISAHLVLAKFYHKKSRTKESARF